MGFIEELFHCINAVCVCLVHYRRRVGWWYMTV